MQGICFIEPLHILTVKGIKVQTRRIVKSSKSVKECNPVELLNEDMSIGDIFFSSGKNVRIAKSRFKLGETVYLKEPYAFIDPFEKGEEVLIYGYLQDECFEDLKKRHTNMKWKNKLFMKGGYARHFIKITAIRVERLQDISDEDCIKEGIINVEFYPDDGFPLSIGYTHYDDGKSILYKTRKEAYKALTDSISGKGTWDSNPYVWVYDYELTNN